MLLGAETFFDLLSVGQIKRGPEFPTIQKTTLGWIVSGKMTHAPDSNSHRLSMMCRSEPIEEISSIDKTLKKFWSLEEVPSESLVKFNPEQHLNSVIFGTIWGSLAFQSESEVVGFVVWDCKAQISLARTTSFEELGTTRNVYGLHERIPSVGTYVVDK